MIIIFTYVPTLILLLGLFLLFAYKSNKQFSRILFSLFILSVAVWVFTLIFADGSKEYEAALLWTRLALVGPIFSIYFLTLFSYFFPKQIVSKRRTSLLLIILSFAPFAQLAFVNTNHNIESITIEDWGSNPVVGHSYTVLLVYILIYIGIAIYNFIRQYRIVKGLKRQQTLYLAVGVVLFIVLATCTNLIALIIGVPQYSIFGPLSSLPLVFAATYSIFRLRLMDIRIIVVRSLIYILLISSILVVFVLTSLTLGSILESRGISEIIVWIMSSISVVLLFGPLKDLFANITDNIFFKNSINYNAAVQDLSNEISTELDLEKLVEVFCERIALLFKVSNADILIRKKKFFVSELETGGIIDRLSDRSPIVKMLKQSKSPIVTDEYEASVTSNAEEKEGSLQTLSVFRESDISVAVPVIIDQKLEAIFLLGNKLSGDAISNQDVSAFKTLSFQLASALERSNLYEKVSEFNERLKNEVKRATAELEEANSELKALDKAKSEFLSIASHQLRTPLTGVIGYSSMLIEGDFGELADEGQEKVVHTIYDASQRLSRVVNSFLNVSRIEAGRLFLNFQKTDLIAMINKVILAMEPSAKKKGLTLIFKPGKKKVKAMVDDKINEVFLNLVDNAIKYTPEGSVTASIEIKDDMVHYKVEDTGVGIAKEEIGHIFQKFVRGSGISHVQPDGSGLGLYIVKQIVEGHKGKIWIESEGLGKGTTFNVTFPVEQAEEAFHAEPQKLFGENEEEA